MKININCVLDEKTASRCKEVNSEIKNLATSEIDFSDNTCRPHITLLMGHVKDEDIEKVKEIVSKVDFKCLKDKVVFDKPVIENKYVMINVKNTEPFKDDCNTLLEQLGDLIEPSQYTISYGSIPHITLSFSKKAEEAGEYINSLEQFQDAHLQNVDVSPAGKFGVVLLENKDDFEAEL